MFGWTKSQWLIFITETSMAPGPLHREGCSGDPCHFIEQAFSISYTTRESLCFLKTQLFHQEDCQCSTNPYFSLYGVLGDLWRASLQDFGSKSMNQRLSRTKPTTRVFYHGNTQIPTAELSARCLSGCTSPSKSAVSNVTRVTEACPVLTAANILPAETAATKTWVLNSKFVWWTFTNLPENLDIGSQSRSSENSALCKTWAACFRKSSKLLNFYTEQFPWGKQSPCWNNAGYSETV